MSDERREGENEAEVEAHGNQSVTEEPVDELGDEVEAHVQRLSSVRMDSPSNT